MTTMKTRLWRKAIVLGAALAIWAPLRGSAEIIEQVLVKVNGDIITKTELEQRQVAALRGRDVDPRNDEQLKKALAEVTPRILVDAIDELLMIQLGRERNYRLTDDQFTRWLSNLRKEQNLEDEQRFQAALQQEGLTLAELRRNVERQFVINQIQQDEVGSKLQITEEEARQFYQIHQREFVEPAAVTLREILIEVPAATQKGQAGVNVGQDDEIAQRAAEVRERIAAGEDFGRLAAEVSAAPSKANGGLIGPIAVSELSPTLQELFQKMKPGETTQPIRIQRGYQIIKLETFKPAAAQPFDSVRDLVADRVYAERQRSEVRKFLNRVRSQAIIVWKNEELKKAYDMQVAAMATAPPGAVQ
ncbi:MAG TPA: peptidylprolyl isomerase [Vicinamibacterales bacterium]|nr:peptidylprolyl isomerase [Vicinamibacterales bacterium]